MRAYLQQLVYRIKGSYWFIPSLMVVSAIVISQVAIALDRRLGNEWLEDFWFTSLNQPEGALASLATVAGSMITVAGVTFSLTILAVSHATSHFGPRLLDNFMCDRGNQVTLGTFVATFLYCLLVLRVVRGEGIPGEEGPNLSVFIPQLSLFLALLLTLASVAELIYFIHHVPESIHVSTVLQRLSRDMSAKFDELYPETVGEAFDQGTGEPLPDFEFVDTVTSRCSGYLQGIDDTALIHFATEKNVVIELLRRPGDFIRENEELAKVSGAEDWDDSCDAKIRFGFTIGFALHTPTQDVFFILNEFVEVATRALSPGVNDPFTAMQCIDWLSVGLVKLSRRKLPTPHRMDSDDKIRVVTTDVTLDQFVDAMLGKLLPYAKDDINVTKYFVDSMNHVIEISKNDHLNRLIRVQIEAIQN